MFVGTFQYGLKTTDVIACAKTGVCVSGRPVMTRMARASPPAS
jgi:hypothetical protein